MDFPGCAVVKIPPANCRRRKRNGFDPWIGKMPWKRKWQHTPVFLPEKSHGQRSLASSSWGHEESDTTEKRSMYIHTHLQWYPQNFSFTKASSGSVFAQFASPILVEWQACGVRMLGLWFQMYCRFVVWHLRSVTSPPRPVSWSAHWSHEVRDGGEEESLAHLACLPPSSDFCLWQP